MEKTGRRAGPGGGWWEEEGGGGAAAAGGWNCGGGGGGHPAEEGWWVDGEPAAAWRDGVRCGERGRCCSSAWCVGEREGRGVVGECCGGCVWM